MDTVGFESQRSDSPELTAEVQPEVIDRILSGEGFDGVSDYVSGLIEKIEEQDIEMYRIAIPKSLGQPLDEYGNTQTAKACRYSNEYLEGDWGQADDPWLYFVERTPVGLPDADAIALSWGDDFPEQYTLNVEKTLERALERPLNPILEEIGWTFTELRGGAQTETASQTTDDWGQYETDEYTEESTEDGEWDSYEQDTTTGEDTGSAWGDW